MAVQAGDRAKPGQVDWPVTNTSWPGHGTVTVTGMKARVLDVLRGESRWPAAIFDLLVLSAIAIGIFSLARRTRRSSP